jgi:thioredoxin 1
VLPVIRKALAAVSCAFTLAAALSSSAAPTGETPAEAPGATATRTVTASAIAALSPAELTAALQGGKPVVMEFGGETCIPCRQMQPVLQEIRTELGAKGRVHNFWIQTHPEVARQFKVMAMPTQIVFDARGTEVFRHIGVFPLPDFRKVLKEKGIL